MTSNTHSENEADNKQLEDWKNNNQILLDAMFSGEVTEAPQNLIKDYLVRLVQISNEVPSIWKGVPKKMVFEPGLAHSLLCGTISLYFGALGWDYALEIPSGDTQSSYRFDVMAQKGENTIIVEVKPDLTIQDFGQILGYILHVKRRFNKVRFFVGTNIENISYLLGGGEITDALVDFAKNHKLGIIFACQNQVWIVPAEFLSIQ